MGEEGRTPNPEVRVVGPPLDRVLGRRLRQKDLPRDVDRQGIHQRPGA